MAILEQKLAIDANSNDNVTLILNQISAKLRQWIGVTTQESQLLLDLLTCETDPHSSSDEIASPSNVIVIIDRLDYMAESLIKLEALYRDSLKFDTTNVHKLTIDLSLPELFGTCDALILRTMRLAKRLHLRAERYRCFLDNMEPYLDQK